MSLPPFDPTSGPQASLTDDHRACDDAWAVVEAVADQGDAALREAFAAFDARTRRHFAMEEETLFPALEAALPPAVGPTSVMRAEHRQVLALLDRMAQQAQADAWNDVFDLGDTLMMVVQQHNLKEEGVLYPLCQAHLRGAWPALAERLARY